MGGMTSGLVGELALRMVYSDVTNSVAVYATDIDALTALSRSPTSWFGGDGVTDVDSMYFWIILSSISFMVFL